MPVPARNTETDTKEHTEQQNRNAPAGLKHLKEMVLGRELGLADTPEVLWPVSPVHRLAFDIDRRLDVVPAGLHIPRVLFNEVPVAGSVVPQVHMRVDYWQFRLNRDLRGGESQPVLVMGLGAAEVRGFRLTAHACLIHSSPSASVSGTGTSLVPLYVMTAGEVGGDLTTAPLSFINNHFDTEQMQEDVNGVP